MAMSVYSSPVRVLRRVSFCRATLTRSLIMLDVQWLTFLDNEGRVVDPKAMKKRVFHGGVEQNLRREVFIQASI